jgi:hypothetical protein
MALSLTDAAKEVRQHVLDVAGDNLSTKDACLQARQEFKNGDWDMADIQGSKTTRNTVEAYRVVLNASDRDINKL